MRALGEMTNEERRLWQHTYAAAFASAFDDAHLDWSAAQRVNGAIEVADFAVSSLREFVRDNPGSDIPVVTVEG